MIGDNGDNAMVCITKAGAKSVWKLRRVESRVKVGGCEIVMRIGLCDDIYLRKPYFFSPRAEGM